MQTSLDPRLSQGLRGLVAFAIGIASWQQLLSPAYHAFRADRQRAETMTGQLATFDAIIRASGSQELWMQQTHSRLTQFKLRFPDQSRIPSLLNTLAEQIAATDLKLLSVTQGNLEEVPDASGAPMTLDGMRILRLPVTVTVEGRFHPVLGWLEGMLSERFPSAVSVEQLHMVLRDPATARLDGTIRLALYVLSP